MDESNQNRKYMLSLSGEFLVAGELLRRKLSAAVTYGNAKKADVVAVKGRVALSIEVKTTQEQKWIVGAKVPDPNESIWVFVYLPPDDSESAEFFVLTGSELHAVMKPIDDAYQKKYFEKHGHSFEGRGIYSVPRKEVLSYKGAWKKIEVALARSNYINENLGHNQTVLPPRPGIA